MKPDWRFYLITWARVGLSVGFIPCVALVREKNVRKAIAYTKKLPQFWCIMELTRFEGITIKSPYGDGTIVYGGR